MWDKRKEMAKMLYPYNTKRKSFQIIRPVISSFQVRILVTKLLKLSPINQDFTCVLEGITVQ